MQINDQNSKFSIYSAIILIIIIVFILGFGFTGYKIYKLLSYQPPNDEQTYQIEYPDLFNKISNTQEPVQIIKGNEQFGTANPFAPKQ